MEGFGEPCRSHLLQQFLNKIGCQDPFLVKNKYGVDIDNIY